MDTTIQPSALDQAAMQTRQYYEQLAQQPPAAAIPPVTQFYNQFNPQQQPRSPEPPSPQIQQQIALLMQSNEQVLALLGNISNAINTQTAQTNHHGQWLDHLIKRLDLTDRRLDRAITTANAAIIGLTLVTAIGLALTFWPKSEKVAIVPSNPIVGIFPG